MAYRTRSARKLVRQTKYNLLATLIIIAFLIFATLNWVLPTLVNGLAILQDFRQQNQTQESPLEKNISEASTLAPPVIFIPYEATNSARIDIKGFATARSKVRIFVDELLRSEVDVKEDGSFVAKDIELNFGTNSIYGKTVDEKDQESLQSKTIRLIYDNEKPSLEISEPQDNQVVKEKKVNITGKTEKNSQVLINEVQVIVTSEGQFQKEQPLNDGENIILIRAIDSASNSEELTRKVIVQP